MGFESYLQGWSCWYLMVTYLDALVSSPSDDFHGND
jgi:hypothetical protein